MTEVLWPLDLCPSSQTWNIIGNAATFTSPLSGATRTYGRPGARMGCTITLPPVKGRDRARMLAFLSALKDRSNRVWVPDFSTTRRGSFASPELLTNNDFSNGTTGWSGTNCSLSHADRVLRLTNTKAGGTTSFFASQTGKSVTQYAPYAVRGFVSPGRYGGWLNGSVLSATSYATDGNGLFTVAEVLGASTTGAIYPAVFDATGDKAVAGDFGELRWASFARCVLVDGGANSLLYSDQGENAAWTKGHASVSAVSGIAPDGEADARALIEDSSSGVEHYMTQSAARSAVAEDLCAFGFFRRRTGTRNIQLSISDGASNGGAAIFNLDAGTAGAAAAAGSGTNPRAFIAPAGDGWYYCAVIARCPASASMQAYFALHNGSSETYNGDGTSSVYHWRCGSARSSVPTRGALTTATATSGSSQTGSGIYVKGLPASTQGLLEAGDPVQIGGQINFLTARLDSDAAGKGYLQCGRPWLAATNDAPVIINTPMCKMILATDTIDLETGPGQFSPFQIELVEAIE
jgi:hypothetical protein